MPHGIRPTLWYSNCWGASTESLSLYIMGKGYQLLSVGMLNQLLPVVLLVEKSVSLHQQHFNPIAFILYVVIWIRNLDNKRAVVIATFALGCCGLISYCVGAGCRFDSAPDDGVFLFSALWIAVGVVGVGQNFLFINPNEIVCFFWKSWPLTKEVDMEAQILLGVNFGFQDFDTTTLLRTTFVFTLLGLILAAAQLALYVLMFFRYQERQQVLMIAAVALLGGSVFCFAISTGLYFDSVLANTGSWLLATTWVTVVVLTTAVIYVFIDWEESGK
ncbi:hypothetical protein CRM22_009751 [Opisthorchis felineus]|uniref:Uncharacterized protein n=1 Tax=Opisthorchis felineus TaxID=147828 RepID=A0A4S2L7A8_OPIFE|nr:hypothetical protein CRM22_009751 [Opisthorchis felineus]